MNGVIFRWNMWWYKWMLLLQGYLLLTACSYSKPQRYIFFLHNRFLETHALEEAHPSYGKVEYQSILERFEQAGFEVISEQRTANVNARTYAMSVVQQIDSLGALGIAPEHITVVGTSKGGYIAQYVSTLAHNPKLNFVFIACFRQQDMTDIPDINYCGNILNIYEKSDPFGTSAQSRKTASTCTIEHFKEIELYTGMEHGFLFKALDEWMQPCIRWANRQYE